MKFFIRGIRNVRKVLAKVWVSFQFIRRETEEEEKRKSGNHDYETSFLNLVKWPETLRVSFQKPKQSSETSWEAKFKMLWKVKRNK